MKLILLALAALVSTLVDGKQYLIDTKDEDPVEDTHVDHLEEPEPLKDEDPVIDEVPVKDEVRGKETPEDKKIVEEMDVLNLDHGDFNRDGLDYGLVGDFIENKAYNFLGKVAKQLKEKKGKDGPLGHLLDGKIKIDDISLEEAKRIIKEVKPILKEALD